MKYVDASWELFPDSEVLREIVLVFNRHPWVLPIAVLAYRAPAFVSSVWEQIRIDRKLERELLENQRALKATIELRIIK